MEALGLILFFVMTLMVVAIAFVWNDSARPYDKGKLAIAAAKDAKKAYNLRYAIVDPAGRVIGLRPEAKEIVLKTIEGSIAELRYDALRIVTLTPVMSSYSESSGEVSTRRGSQLIGAGVGAVVAGPLGAVVGGLSGSQIQQTSTIEEVPRFTMHAGSPDSLGGSVMLHELGEAFKDMAARLANIVDS